MFSSYLPIASMAKETQEIPESTQSQDNAISHAHEQEKTQNDFYDPTIKPKTEDVCEESIRSKLSPQEEIRSIFSSLKTKEEKFALLEKEWLSGSTIIGKANSQIANVAIKVGTVVNLLEEEFLPKEGKYKWRKEHIIDKYKIGQTTFFKYCRIAKVPQVENYSHLGIEMLDKIASFYNSMTPEKKDLFGDDPIGKLLPEMNFDEDMPEKRRKYSQAASISMELEKKDIDNISMSSITKALDAFESIKEKDVDNLIKELINVYNCNNKDKEAVINFLKKIGTEEGYIEYVKNSHKLSEKTTSNTKKPRRQRIKNIVTLATEARQQLIEIQKSSRPLTEQEREVLINLKDFLLEYLN